MTKFQRFAAAAALSFALACGGSEDPGEEIGGSGDYLTTTNSVAAVGSLATALIPVVEEITAEPAAAEADPPMRSDGDPEPVEPAPPVELEDSPSCVSIEWNISSPLRVTFVFDNCPLENGEVIDGAITARLTYVARRIAAVSLTFEDLVLSSHLLDGTLVGSIDNDSITFGGDILFRDGETGDTVQLNDTVLDKTSSFVIVDTLVWENLPNNCFPTTGTMDLTIHGVGTAPAWFDEDAEGPALYVQALPPPAAPLRYDLPSCSGEETP
jgi:hypothetical protein